jgi:hypothetical protein
VQKCGNAGSETALSPMRAGDLREIDAAAQIAVQGDRYPEQLERLTGR